MGFRDSVHPLAWPLFRIKSGQGWQQAFCLLDEMRRRDVAPDSSHSQDNGFGSAGPLLSALRYTYSALLGACRAWAREDEARSR